MNLEQAALAVQRGDPSAFEFIVNATSERLVRLSARMLGNVTDAEDAVQEAYVKAFRAITGGDFDGRAKVETWLYRIVVNTSIDHKRRRAKRPLVSDELVESAAQMWTTADLLEAADAHVALKELSEWLSSLPEDQQTVLLLKGVEGMSSGEIADVMECSEGAVEQRLVRARAALRQRRDGS